MKNLLQTVEQELLEPAEISEQELSRVLGGMVGPNVDYGDLYFQSTQHESWSLEDGIIKDAGFDLDRGVGVRVNSGEKTGFAYSDEVLMPALTEAAGAARSIARGGGGGSVQAWRKNRSAALYRPLNPLDSLQSAEKVSLLKKVDEFCRARDPRVVQVNVSMSAVHESILVAANDGTLAADIRPLVRLNVSVLAEQAGRRERGSAGGGGRVDYQTFLANDLAFALAEDAVRQALLNLEAVAAPAGAMPVVLGPGWPGILLHEAIGHGLEGDFNRKGTSAFSGRIGERVASPGCTVVDDGTLKDRRGSLNIDDEGTETECTVLIEDGILRGYMQDKLNARLTGTRSTGNGRRESYAHLPMPRMTNTYMLAGQSDPEEIIASVDNGLYAVNFGGGQVDITSGKFVFSASEAYLIENGKIGAPVKGATLIGNGPDVLTRVSMIGNDLKLDTGVGTCGKDGQSVPVGVGQPTLKVDELVVGGTGAN